MIWLVMAWRMSFWVGMTAHSGWVVVGYHDLFGGVSQSRRSEAHEMRRGEVRSYASGGTFVLE